jgi:hypothetical protein
MAQHPPAMTVEQLRTQVRDGAVDTVIVNGTNGNDTIQVQGNGTSGTTTLGINSGKTLKIVINGTTPDSGYTQLNVAGLVNISGVSLALILTHRAKHDVERR